MGLAGLDRGAVPVLHRRPGTGKLDLSVRVAASRISGYYLFLVLAYRHGELSQVYPIARGSAPLLVAVSAWLLPPYEVLAGWQMAGVAAISIGILSLSVEKPLTGQHKWEPVAFGLLTGICIMGYMLCDGLGVRACRRHGSAAIRLYRLAVRARCADAGAVLRVAAGLPAGASATGRGPGSWAWPVAALSAGAYAISIFAMKDGAFAQVSALRETSVIFAAIMSAVPTEGTFPQAALCVGQPGGA